MNPVEDLDLRLFLDALQIFEERRKDLARERFLLAPIARLSNRSSQRAKGARTAVHQFGRERSCGCEALFVLLPLHSGVPQVDAQSDRVDRHARAPRHVVNDLDAICVKITPRGDRHRLVM